MNTDICTPRRLRGRAASAIALLWLCIEQVAAPATRADCELPNIPSAPAAGEYQGYFRLVCEMQIPASPKLVIPMKFEGDLTFTVGRQDLDDSRAPVAPAPEKRRPLRPPSGTSRNAPDPVAVDAVSEAARLEAALDAAVSKANSGYLYISPNERPRVEGVSNVSVDARYQHAVADAQMSGQVGTKRTMPFEVRGEENPLTSSFDELSLWGTKDQSAFAGSFRAAAPDMRTSGNLDFHETGATGQVTGQDSRGRTYTRDVNLSTGGTSAPAPQEDKYQRERRKFDEAYDRLFGRTDPKMKLITLTVTQAGCWSFRGTVRAEQMEENLKRQGIALVVKESEWVATLVEREPAFEQRVEALAAEPIPTPITWAYIDSFADRWKALRQEATTDYKRCVVKQLIRKFVAMQSAGLQELTRNVPRARDGANCVVMRASFERSLPIIRTLQLYGLGDCPDVSDYWRAVERETREIIKQLLARQHTPQQLACYLGMAKFIDLGDQTDPFWAAWHEVESAAALQHPL